MEQKILLAKIFIYPVLSSIFNMLGPVDPFAILFYCVATFGVVYTVIIPSYKRKKKHKKWVKEGMPKEDRYKWEDVQ